MPYSKVAAATAISVGELDKAVILNKFTLEYTVYTSIQYKRSNLNWSSQNDHEGFICLLYISPLPGFDKDETNLLFFPRSYYFSRDTS